MHLGLYARGLAHGVQASMPLAIDEVSTSPSAIFACINSPIRILDSPYAILKSPTMLHCSGRTKWLVLVMPPPVGVPMDMEA